MEMTSFTFYSDEPYGVVVQRLNHLSLGNLEVVHMTVHPQEYEYTVYYSSLTCTRILEAMYTQPSCKLIYGVNANGYPVYWTIWFN